MWSTGAWWRNGTALNGPAAVTFFHEDSMPPPAVGTPAPDFTLPATSGKDVSLSGLRGKNVLLAFFPLAFTPPCTTELHAFSNDYAQFQSAETVVLPVSVDSIPTLKEFKAKGN